ASTRTRPASMAGFSFALREPPTLCLDRTHGGRFQGSLRPGGEVAPKSRGFVCPGFSVRAAHGKLEPLRIDREVRNDPEGGGAWRDRRVRFAHRDAACARRTFRTVAGWTPQGVAGGIARGDRRCACARPCTGYGECGLSGGAGRARTASGDPRRRPVPGAGL